MFNWILNRFFQAISLCFLLLTSTFGGENSKIFGFSLEPRESYWGLRRYERVGYAMSPAGDVNGDGFDDFLIGTFHNTEEGYDAGAAYLILGHELAGTRETESLAAADARFLGNHSYDAVGSSVAGPGDLNGDGLDDIVIGAPAGNDEVPENPGHVFIVFGKKQVNWGWDFILENSADVNLVGELARDDGIDKGGLAGFSTAIIQDMNGDGCDELLVGAPYWDGYHSDGGKVYLIPGQAEGWPELGTLAEKAIATFRCSSSRAANLGFSLADLGDVNGDSISDFAIGAPGKSQAFVFYGRTEMDWGHEFLVEDADAVFYGESSRHQAGRQVIGPGDVNGDGYNDFVVSAIRNNDTEYDAGKVYLILGREHGWSHSNNLVDADGSWCGEVADDYAGWSLGAVGDFDGDHLNDFVIGMFNDPDRSKPGRAYYIGGRSHHWPREKNLAELHTTFIGEENGDLTGFCVSGAGDVNGDGWDDFLVACPYYSKYVHWGGQILLFASERNYLSVTGKVLNSYNKVPMTNIQVILESKTNQTAFSNSQGQFQFSCWEGADYRLFATIDSTSRRSRSFVTAYDAAVVTRHVAGIEPLADKEQLAADVDLDEKVTMLDAALIFHFSLQSPDDGQIGKWIFYPKVRDLKSISGDRESQNFLGVISGNADGSTRLLKPSLADQTALAKELNMHVSIIDSLSIPISSEKVLAFNLSVNYQSDRIKQVKFEPSESVQKFVTQTEATPGHLRVAGYTLNIKPDLKKLGHLKLYNDTQQPGETHLTVALQINNEPVQISKYNIVPEQQTELPLVNELSQNFPNPFNSTTLIKYALASKSRIVIRIFNALGQEVFTQDLGRQPAGFYELKWNGRGKHGNLLPSGIYFYQISTDNFSQIRKCVLMY